MPSWDYGSNCLSQPLPPPSLPNALYCIPSHPSNGPITLVTYLYYSPRDVLVMTSTLSPHISLLLLLLLLFPATNNFKTTIQILSNQQNNNFNAYYQSQGSSSEINDPWHGEGLGDDEEGEGGGEGEGYFEDNSMEGEGRGEGGEGEQDNTLATTEAYMASYCNGIYNSW